LKVLSYNVNGIRAALKKGFADWLQAADPDVLCIQETKALQEQVDTEIDETENLSKKLLTLQLAFDMGEISEEDFEAQEEELLLAIQALEEQKLKEEEEDA